MRLMGRTEVRTGIDKQAVIDFAEKMLDQIGDDEEVRKLIDEAKERLKKEKEKLSYYFMGGDKIKR